MPAILQVADDEVPACLRSAAPHFHARYGRHRALLAIPDAAVIRGDLPPRALQLVREWARMHRTELEDDWRRARRSEPLYAVDPLE